MNEEKQKKEGMFRTFWTKIEDLESAQVAASGGANGSKLEPVGALL
tara:strand:+ start:1325 stop:1462 length:138 start_codon:yes stop_codon:yes gene_type:complete